MTGKPQIDEHMERSEEGRQIDRLAEQRGRLDFPFSHLHVNHHLADIVGPVQVERTTNRNPAAGDEIEAWHGLQMRQWEYPDR